MTENQQLLAEYAANGSETAFRELVARYINFVYSTARRLVGEHPHLAEDVTQVVFINLAKKGPTLSSGVLLGGWLHQHTFHVATKAVRSERRRQSREREAVEMNTLQDDSEANLRKLEPMLDEAITRLGNEDRSAILLRFFEHRDFHAVGEALGSNEDAARMRVKRALEKLHVLLKHRDATLSVGALGALLTTGAVTAAPTGLALTTARIALAGATAGTGAILTIAKLMTTAKLKLFITGLSIAVIASALLIYHGLQVGPGAELQPSPQQTAQLSIDHSSAPTGLDRANVQLSRSPVPSIRPRATNTAAPAESPTESGPPIWLANKASKLAAAQVEQYLKVHERNPASLLAAFRSTDDPALLQEAMQNYPQDPKVAFEAVLRMDAPPAERSQWLDALKQSAPENALPDYLSALDHFRAGRTVQALQELQNASGKEQFQDYSLNRARDDEEAYLTAGRSAGEAKLAATVNLRLPHLAQIGELGRNLVNLANSYQQAGDETSRQATLQMAVNLGRRYSGGSAGESLISQLVGINVERRALEAMDSASPSGATNQTVQERIDQLLQQRTAIRDLNQQAEPLWQTMSDEDWAGYLGRAQVLGEQRALTWLVSEYGQK
jgi:RNA polymerase sigma factor (sigma-70 family)